MPCTPPTPGVAFNEPTLDASPCAFKVVLPLPKFSLNFPAIPFPPPFLPKFNLHLAITCSLDKPVDVSGGVSFGGGRIPCFEESPDDQEG